jgi:hypothetical protein
VAGIVAAMLVILPGIPLAAALTHRPTRLNAPYSVLCAELRKRAGEPSVIAADTRLVGGNLRLTFQKSKVIAPEFRSLDLETNDNWLIVWDATKRADPSPSLIKLVRDLRGRDLTGLAPSFVEAPCKYIPSKKQKLGYVLLR